MPTPCQYSMLSTRQNCPGNIWLYRCDIVVTAAYFPGPEDDLTMLMEVCLSCAYMTEDPALSFW